MKNVRGGVESPSKYTRITTAYESFSNNIETRIQKSVLTLAEKKNIKRKHALISKVILTQSQMEEIDDFYMKHYGKKLGYSWHRLYQSYTGKYHKDYFPEILFTTELEPLLNPYRFANVLSDKNLLHQLFDSVEDVKIPQNYISCIYGRYRDSRNVMISRGDTLSLLSSIGECVIKKTIDTSSGRDVMICNIIEGIDRNSNHSAEDIINMMGDNFLVQEKLKQCKALSDLNASSINTFRVMTYILKDRVFVCPVALRLGRNNCEKDNLHAGGIAVGITDEGILRKKAYSEYGEEFCRHPDSNVEFDGYRIPCFEKIITKARHLHECIPQLGIVSWDLSLNENNEVALIEINPIRQGSWLPQMVNGEPLFGNNTSEMLRLIRK